MSKFKVGDRVRIVRCNSHDSTTCEEHGSDVGKVTTITKIDTSGWADDYPYSVANSRSNWNDDELELATNKGGEMDKPYQRKTYKLLKDTEMVRRGALMQEMCDDGDQDFKLLDESFLKFGKPQAGRGDALLPRKAVEDQPKWFVEVFAVEPQYMTREELDQWEAFKSRKKPGRKAKSAGVDHAKPGADYTVLSTIQIAKPRKRKSNWTPAKRRAQSRKLKAAWAARKAREVAA